jgi:16S rRNA (uracil1498-N3)-methyltransferase
MIPRVFVPFDRIQNNSALIDGSNVNYLKNVLRLKVGDEIIVMDSKSREFSSKIVLLDKGMIKAELIDEKHPKSESKVKITIAQSLPKNPKMDIVIQKSTELGAEKIIPVMTERSVVKISAEKESGRIDRWRKIAKEAAEQSGRTMIPLIEGIKNLDDVLAQKDDFDGRILLWEMEKEMTLKKFLQKNRGIKNLLVLIGPEGGFSRKEADLAKKNGFATVSIGNRILRTETASLAVLSMINYEFEL